MKELRLKQGVCEVCNDYEGKVIEMYSVYEGEGEKETSFTACKKCTLALLDREQEVVSKVLALHKKKRG